MKLEVLPTRTAGAAENMAVDFLLLQRYPAEGVLRFRHYDWRRPAFTFGYAQKIAFVRAQLPPDEQFDLCRRPTGGGIVDHRDDWTYALVIPRGHPLEELRAVQSYRAVHQAIVDALRELGVDAVLKPAVEEQEENSPGVCFQRAETFDVIRRDTGAKIAGAAQKRNKHGLLFQGSVWRPAAGDAALDWERFENDFVARLAVALSAEATAAPWAEFQEDELEGLTERYSSAEWLEYR